jgi:ATP-binding cassette subfamily F protein 3
VLELEGGKSVYFPGAWHIWRREQASRAIHQTKTAARQAEQIVRLERFVERFRYKASKARQAQMKIKQIKKLEAVRVHAPDDRKRSLGFEFLKPARSGRDVVVAENLVIRAGDKELLDGATFAIERGEHVALVGPNGSGKTTLLETMLGLRPAASGVVRLGHGVEPAYFSQHEAELDERGSVLEAAMVGTGLKRPEAQSLLGKFLFSGWDEHEKPVSVLSGGERRRLALAIAVASGANFLVLDEPTNHLDLESREALEAALEAFPGTVLLVSHDRALLDAVAGRLLAVESKTIASYPGGWADYVSAQEAGATPPPPPPKPKAEKPRREPKPKASQIDLVEAEVARAESRLAELEAKLAEDWGDAQLVAEHRAAREDLEALLSRWEALFESTTP